MNKDNANKIQIKITTRRGSWVVMMRFHKGAKWHLDPKAYERVGQAMDHARQLCEIAGEHFESMAITKENSNE